MTMVRHVKGDVFMKNITVTVLRLERERRGWSRSYVAERIGVDVATVGRWERGERVPHPYHRQKLCALFEMNAQNLGLLSMFLQKLNAMATVTNLSPEVLRSALRTSSTNTKVDALRSVSESPNLAGSFNAFSLQVGKGLAPLLR